MADPALMRIGLNIVRRRYAYPMKAIDGYFLIKPDDLAWRPSNIMQIPNADFLERSGSQILGAS